MKVVENEMNYNVLIIIKPDGLQFLSTILQKLNENCLTIRCCKSLNIDKEKAQAVYQQHRGKYFFPALVNYLTMSSCIVLAINGSANSIANGKKCIRELAKIYAARNVPEVIAKFLSKMSDEEKIKTNFEKIIPKISDEYMKTFDGIHCSDILDGERELGVFFNPEDWCEPVFDIANACEIVNRKLAAQPLQALSTNIDFASQSLNFFNK